MFLRRSEAPWLKRLISSELAVGGMMAGTAAISAGAPLFNVFWSGITGVAAGWIYMIFGLALNILGIDDATRYALIDADQHCTTTFLTCPAKCVY